MSDADDKKMAALGATLEEHGIAFYVIARPDGEGFRLFGKFPVEHQAALDFIGTMNDYVMEYFYTMGRREGQAQDLNE